MTRQLVSLIMLTATFNAFADIDMDCYERCRERGSTNCGGQCTKSSPQTQQIPVPVEQGYKPSGALGGWYEGERAARESNAQTLQLFQMMRQIEADNKQKQQQLELQRAIEKQRQIEDEQKGEIKYQQKIKLRNEQKIIKRIDELRLRQQKVDQITITLNSKSKANSSFEKALQAVKENKDQKKVFNLFLKAANEGHPVAQHIIGVFHAQGTVVEKNDNESFRWHKKSADQGYSPAEMSIGLAYLTGEGAIKDPNEGLRWINRAADQRNHEAQYFLAEIYAKGSNVTKDEIESMAWLLLAANEGNSSAQLTLGKAYLAGVTINRNDVEGFNWIKKSAEKGEAEALAILRQSGVK